MRALGQYFNKIPQILLQTLPVLRLCRRRTSFMSMCLVASRSTLSLARRRHHKGVGGGGMKFAVRGRNSRRICAFVCAHGVESRVFATVFVSPTRVGRILSPKQVPRLVDRRGYGDGCAVTAGALLKRVLKEKKTALGRFLEVLLLLTVDLRRRRCANNAKDEIRRFVKECNHNTEAIHSITKHSNGNPRGL